MTLGQTYAELRDALTPLGIEIGAEVVALWRDRERHSLQPLPTDALRHLADLATRLLVQAPP